MLDGMYSSFGTIDLVSWDERGFEITVLVPSRKRSESFSVCFFCGTTIFGYSYYTYPFVHYSMVVAVVSYRFLVKQVLEDGIFVCGMTEEKRSRAFFVSPQ